MSAVPSSARRWANRWLDHRLGVPDREMRLSYRRIFILPSRGGLLFALMVFAIWLGAVNYINNMAYLLAFLLTGLGGVSMIHSVRNLLGLELVAESPAPVFAGQTLHFPIRLTNPASRTRYGLQLRLRGGDSVATDVPGGGSVRVSLPVPGPDRGVRRMPVMRLHSVFPGGLFTSWSWPRFRREGLVYPRAEDGRVPPPDGSGGDGEGHSASTGEEDFAGLRRYQAGDPVRQLAWRSWARGMELQTKQFGREDHGQLWLDWRQTRGLDTERRLSRLCRWILDCDDAGMPFGLRLPGVVLEPSSGPQHRHACLAALARHPGGPA